MDTEMIAMQIIAGAGDGKGLAFEALEAAKEGRFEEVGQLMKESNQASVTAHNAQTKILVASANGEPVPMDVLLVHSQDHLMTGIIAQEMIQEMIQMYQRIHDLEEKVAKLGGNK